MKTCISLLFLLVTLAALVAGCQSQSAAAGGGLPAGTVEFTLQTGVGDGGIYYQGVGGDIDGVKNPDLVVPLGVAVRIVLINGDGMSHDLSIPDFTVKTPVITVKGQKTELVFTVSEDSSGAYPYFCTQPGHRQAGQGGRLVVNAEAG